MKFKNPVGKKICQPIGEQGLLFAVLASTYIWFGFIKLI
jgi:hypothetical protein